MAISAPPSPLPTLADPTAAALAALHEQALIEEARRRARRRRRRNGAAALLAVSGALIALTAIRAGHGHGHPQPPAAPTRPSATGGPPRPAPASDAAITILHNRPSAASSISVAAPGARAVTLWRCPHDRFCGELVNAAWAPDGRRLAISLTQFAGHSPYPGLHIIDTATGQDRRISGQETIAMSYGCDALDQMAWSPDGAHIAYVCEVTRNGYATSRIHIMNADGTHPRLLPTGTAGSAWPSWSPDGAQRRLLYRQISARAPERGRSATARAIRALSRVQRKARRRPAPTTRPGRRGSLLVARRQGDRIPIGLRTSSPRSARRPRRHAPRHSVQLCRHGSGGLAGMGARRKAPCDRHDSRHLPRQPGRQPCKTHQPPLNEASVLSGAGDDRGADRRVRPPRRRPPRVETPPLAGTEPRMNSPWRSALPLLPCRPCRSDGGGARGAA